MNGCTQVIKEMYLINLKKYATDANAFADFFKAAVGIAKYWKINAIFYDEVASLSTLLLGKFLHAAKDRPAERVCTI